MIWLLLPLLLQVLLVPSLGKKEDGMIRVDIDWSNVTAISKTVATLQVVSNPILNMKISPVAKTLLDNLHQLQADLVRYVPWFPYPHYAVAELEPPNATSQTTSWYFSDELKQEFLDTFHAVTTSTTTTGGDNTKDKRLVINFSTQPAWMFDTRDWTYVHDPNRADWGYPKGRWINATTQLVADYYGRLAEWMILGHFQDEYGHVHTGGPVVDVTDWEIFNEPEGEHGITWHQYNILFDAIVRAIRLKADPQHKIRFFGMALEGHNEWDFWQGFLTLENHAPDVRDAVAHGYASFHWYAGLSSRTNADTFENAFDQIPTFLKEVDHILALRDRLSPTTQLALNEAGVIPPQDNNPHAEPSPPIYFNMAAGLYTVLVSELAVKGVDVVGSSQFCGCEALPLWNIPDRQFPGVSMTNWTTGQGNPRYWALKLYLQYFGPGDQILATTTPLLLSSKDVYVQGRITHRGNKYVVIVVNKTNRPQTLTMQHWKGAHVSIVDESTHDQEWKTFTLDSDVLTLERFAVAVVNVAKTPDAIMTAGL